MQTKNIFFDGNNNNKELIRIFHQNMGGILSKRDLFQTVLRKFSSNNIDIDVICISETFIKSGTESNLNILTKIN